MSRKVRDELSLSAPPVKANTSEETKQGVALISFVYLELYKGDRADSELIRGRSKGEEREGERCFRARFRNARETTRHAWIKRKLPCSSDDAVVYNARVCVVRR